MSVSWDAAMRKLDPFKAADKDRRPIDYYAKVFRKPFFVLSSTCYSIDSKWLFTKLSESLKFLKLIIDSLQSVRAACFKNGAIQPVHHHTIPIQL